MLGRKTQPIPSRLVDWLGWYGVAAILLAYGLISFKFLSVTDVRYQLLNITGSVGLIIEAYTRRDTQPIVLNIIWVGIGIVALLSSWL